MNIQNFNTHIATVYGVNQAIFIQSMVQFTFSNSSEERNLHDNRYWCYGTPKFFAQYFPYFKPRLIKEIISKCVKDGLLIVGNYNRTKYDRTNWYALSNKALIELNLDITCHKSLNLTIERNPSNQLDDSCSINETEDVPPIPIKNNKEKIKNTSYSVSDETREKEVDEIKTDYQKPVGKSKVTYGEVIEVFKEECPNLKQPHANKLSKENKKVCNELVRDWKLISSTGDKFSLDAFRRYLQTRKKLEPQVFEPWHRDDGSIYINGFKQICEIEKITKFIERQQARMKR